MKEDTEEDKKYKYDFDYLDLRYAYENHSFHKSFEDLVEHLIKSSYVKPLSLNLAQDPELRKRRYLGLLKAIAFASFICENKNDPYTLPKDIVKVIEKQIAKYD